MVDVEPGDVIAEVFVIVNVNVFVCELKLQTIVAVESWPDVTPVTVIVSARVVTAAPLNIKSAANERSICQIEP